MKAVRFERLKGNGRPAAAAQEPDRTHGLGRARAGARPASRHRRLSRLRRAGGDRVHRLYGPRQFRHQHPGRRQIRLRPLVGGAAGQSDRHAVPGAVGQARHRHRAQSRRDVPRAFPPARGLRHVGGERDRRHGDRPGGIFGRRGRAVAVVPHAAARRHDRHGHRHLRHPDGGEPRLPPGRIDHRQLRGDHRALLPDRDIHRPCRLGRGLARHREARDRRCRRAAARGRHHRRHGHAARGLSAFRPDAGAHPGQ